MKTVKKKKNYGKLLKRTINKKGLTKYKIAEQLGISRPTLETRMIDGEFKPNQLEIVKQIIK